MKRPLPPCVNRSGCLWRGTLTGWPVFRRPCSAFSTLLSTPTSWRPQLRCCATWLTAWMLERARASRGAMRARASRARRRQGIFTYRLRAHRRRLIAALRAAGADGELDQAEIELELDELVEKFIVRWVGKIPCA